MPNRTAYLKLRFFADSGCIFVGHGLQKDFEPQISLYQEIKSHCGVMALINQRKLSLRFLAAYVLKEDIQDEIQTPLKMRRPHCFCTEHTRASPRTDSTSLQSVLQEMYAYGNKSNWSIRQDLIEDTYISLGDDNRCQTM